jgi:hypothetical protein
MSGSDWVAVAGLAIGAAVSIVVTAINIWFQRRAARLQAQRERLGELRNVLDLAGGAVSEAIAAAQRRVVARGDAVKETGESFEDKHGAVRVFENRIAIRLGKDDVVTRAYHHVGVELKRVGRSLFDARGELDENARTSTNKEIKRVRELQLAYLECARGVVNRDI